MDLSCLNDIIKNGLGVHIDISDNNSWNLNTGLTSISLTKWKDAVSDDLLLYDYGLTLYDNGRSDRPYDSLSLNQDDLKVNLYRVGFNTLTGLTSQVDTGTTQYSGFEMTGVTGGSVGNYFELNGGYLQGFFKLQQYNHELFPPRYGQGITIENVLRIDSNSNGIFYLMGARSEDKYNNFFSGETKQQETITTTSVSTGVVGLTGEVTKSTTTFSGVTTSEQNYLSAFVNEDVYQKGFSDFANQKTNIPILQSSGNTHENIIAFKLEEDKRITILRVGSSGIIDYKTSDNIVVVTGWTTISTVFEPYQIITDKKELKCADRRLGDLVFYVNGRKFWKIKDYSEFYFKDFKNHKEKVIGVPYNISFGGGSFGLKHSYHYDNHLEYLFNNNSGSIYIDNNFILKENPFNNDPCKLTGITYGNITLTGNNTTFSVKDDCGTGSTNINVIQANYSGNTGITSNNEYYIEYIDDIKLISNRDYMFSVDVYDTGIFQSSATTGTIQIKVSGQTDFNIIDSNIYSIKKDLRNNWYTIFVKGRLKENTNIRSFKVGLLIESNIPINENFNLYLKDYKYYGSDLLSQDENKDNLLVEEYFDSSYIGAIQKLRIYDYAFNSEQIKHNRKYDIINNSYPSILTDGGRIITK